MLILSIVAVVAIIAITFSSVGISKPKLQPINNFDSELIEDEELLATEENLAGEARARRPRPTPPPRPIPCTDSDNGQDLYNKGKTCVGNSCKSDVCIWDKKRIREFYCDAGAIKSIITNCPNSCSNGACGTNVSCTDECYPGVVCLSNSTTQYRVCRSDFDSDSCYELGPIENCPAGDECQHGICVRTTITEQVECIFNGSTTKQECYSAKGSCTGIESCGVSVKGNKGEKIEWKSSCGGYVTTIIDGINDYAVFKCGFVPVCTDSDNGQDLYIQGQTCVGNSCKSDVCIWDKKRIREFYCDNGLIKSIITNCPNSCSNGACGTNVSCTDECYPAGLKQCTSNNAFRICGNYDSDSCLEWNAAKCEVGEVCKNGNCERQLIDNEDAIIKKDMYFILTSPGGSKFTLQYKGANKISSGIPILKFKDLGSGYTIEQAYTDSSPLATLKIGGYDFGVYKSPQADLNSNDFDIQVDLNGNGLLEGWSLQLIQK